VYRGTRINIVDTPGHADFGGEVERTLKMVDGVMLLVDASEGPLPQTRFVLRKAFESGLAPDRRHQQDRSLGRPPKEVLNEVYDLFIDLDATEEQLEFPVLYANARRGIVRRTPDGADEPLTPLFEEILKTVPPPSYDDLMPLQLLITTLDYNDYVGRLAIGRVFNGPDRQGKRLRALPSGRNGREIRVTALYGYDGLKRVEIDEAGPGDVVAVARASGRDDRRDDLRRRDADPAAADHRGRADDRDDHLDQRLAGRRPRGPVRDLAEAARAPLEGDPDERLHPRRGDRLARRVQGLGRGELQLAILIEMMRREGYEMSVGKPSIVTEEIDGKIHEPQEQLIVDCPEGFVGS
jgi:GTP-binding protein